MYAPTYPPDSLPAADRKATLLAGLDAVSPFLAAVREAARALVIHHRQVARAADLGRVLVAAGLLAADELAGIAPDPAALPALCRGLVERGSLDRSDPVFDGVTF